MLIEGEKELLLGRVLPRKPYRPRHPLTELNVLEGWTPTVPEEAKNTDFIMFGNLDPTIQTSVLDQMTTTPKLVVLDTMNFWMDTALDNLKHVVSRVNVLMINDDEARQLSGETSLAKAAKKIHVMGPETVVIKKESTGRFHV